MKVYAYQLFDQNKRLILGSSNIFYSELDLENFAKNAKKSIPNYTNFERAKFVGHFVKIEFGFQDLKYIDNKLVEIK